LKTLRDHDTGKLLSVAVRAALEAGAAIMEVYGQDDFSVKMKADDSPVTAADLRAEEIITSVLAPCGLPLLSEEGQSVTYKERKEWKLFWIVDPLDGTKEFIDRNGEFTVNIALVEGEVPVAGVVYIPASDILYTGIAGGGAMKYEGASRGTGIGVPLPSDRMPGYRITGSRSFMDENTLRFIEEFKARFEGSTMITRGGAAKLCMIAEGSADIYPRFSSISEWDTAAGQAIIAASGGFVVRAADPDSPLAYNKEKTLNPWFIAFRDRELLESVRELIPEFQ
jgi:3'(2'), 5'-bisphosphate nucleotidase